MLTIASTVLVGRRCWEGWALATVNSVIICIIAIRTAQFGFVPANVFCIAMSVINLHSWRTAQTETLKQSAAQETMNATLPRTFTLPWKSGPSGPRSSL